MTRSPSDGGEGHAPSGAAGTGGVASKGGEELASSPGGQANVASSELEAPGAPSSEVSPSSVGRRAPLPESSLDVPPELEGAGGPTAHARQA
jgi:hypothetical protein